MKQRDIITLAVAASVIVVSIVAMVFLLNPPAKKQDTKNSEADKIQTIPTEIDENTYGQIEKFSDYGKPSLENIGKADLFSN